ncbi:DNA relaxase [Parashewanella spongiae]|uniref:DNA relaxase n=2 Tax=Parashewanella spongiae TaxID=342950 RepID=A0A3A6TQL1_9GAMM|nr:DNA relaxase [Parashewanella spongiae]
MSHSATDYTSDLLTGDVRHKSNRIKSSSCYTRKPPEVMVKISGYCYSSDHTKSHFDYITRNGKLELEDKLGETYNDRNIIHQLANDWQDPQTNSKRRTRHSTHLVLSMPDGTDPKAVKQAVRQFAKKIFAHNYQYVMALHTDTDSPHVHLTIKNLGFDGKQLHVRKGLPQIWREQFVCELERQGVAAEATPSLNKLRMTKQIENQDHYDNDLSVHH